VTVEVSPAQQRSNADAVWNILLAAAAMAGELERDGRPRVFGEEENGLLRLSKADGSDAVLAWHPLSGWESLVSPPDARSELLDLYLPICGATAARPITIGHLGQSLDGFIATHAGESQFVTGDDNIIHLHRMRALCDAVVVGAGTVAADDPQLTTRHVLGPNPLRVILDPARRLSAAYRVFTDQLAPTLYVCARSAIARGETLIGNAEIVGFDADTPEQGVTNVLRLLRGRGHSRVFVEGGGVTVSRFLEANLLDRLQIAIAPVLIGDGRPAIRMTPHARLSDCRRPGYRVFRMGGDVLFDCELGVDADIPENTAPGTVTRVI
jgi:diaminohydroxyphosphoribosylaminopyrimidine deaminase / 5-amino-6-(5-phosphoribosylamino)uracil reductase